MNVLIYGAGAVGLGIASCLLNSGERVTFVGRTETLDSLKANGLQRTGIFGSVSTPPTSFAVQNNLKKLVPQHFDYVLVCVKSFDTETAATELATLKWIDFAATKLVLCQNGWGNTEKFEKCFPKKAIYTARIITGFKRPELNQVDITVHADPIQVGSLYRAPIEAVENLCQSIDKGGISAVVTSEIGKHLWSKMLFNCLLNPLGAVLGVTYGELGSSEYTRGIMNQIAKEIFRVMHANKYATFWDTPEQFLKFFYEKMVPFTAAHESSMLQDVRAHRRTEIDALNGVVIELGKKSKADTPVNETMRNFIKRLEEKSLSTKKADVLIDFSVPSAVQVNLIEKKANGLLA